jgi:alpha-tubulin suppressor-like RCC1 family protein
MNAYVVSSSVSKDVIILSKDGTALVWGRNAKPCLGQAQIIYEPTPFILPGGHKIAVAAAGRDHFLALTENPQHLFSWGKNSCALGRLMEGVPHIPGEVCPLIHSGYATFHNFY